MSQENAKRFMELMNEDEGLQKKVKESTAAYIGDRLDEKAVFEAVIAPSAKEVGLEFSYEDMVAFAEEAGEGELSEDELSMAAGGVAHCVIIGGGTGKSWKKGHGGGACKYVGVGFFEIL